ncbi:hypothetical protein PR202_ga10345 [Eleusine coracana subsp. coracana]|uniref:Leucine-rich repeat-containing N-terminal plant-type domain-containing protein n=1 Tax=Eleusine coracana subsp. coracana TaxID=191504 RepID=A0AAV5C6H2_ELECO|nr:hypothetical protein PR202_ga10345 [Eleusine coracana subsp. coracana]
MAMSTALPLLLLLSASSSMSTVQGVEANDAAALLAFKAAAVGDGGYRLLSWNASSTGEFCSWEGVTCQGKPRRVVALNLSSHGLNGVLSPAIGNMSSLKVLNLGSNMLSGAIPASLGRLQHLEILNLSSNSLSGDIPTNLSSCTSLTTIELQSNQLYGRLPPELGNKLTRLEVLKLWKNNLTGTIPTSLANLSSLSFVSLAFNQFEGTIPSGLGGIAGLRHLDLAYNHISGEPPRSIYNLSSFEVLQLEGNMLHGEIPNDIGKYGEGSSISTLGDVYSLGILLLEMFTGRSPTDDMFRGSLDLHKFSEDALPERIWEIADSTMWMHQGAYNSPSRSRTQSCLVSVIALGISCSKKQPRERILIHDAAIQIHAIRDSYLMFAKPFFCA